jgi:hypothetical protein
MQRDRELKRELETNCINQILRERSGRAGILTAWQLLGEISVTRIAFLSMDRRSICYEKECMRSTE